MSRCCRCDGTTGLIEDDGDVVCQGCITSLGEIVADPGLTTERIRDELLNRHADVLTLFRVVVAGKDPRYEWAWTAPWPTRDVRAGT